MVFPDIPYRVGSNRPDSVLAPLTWLYWPVRMLARLGTQIEFVQKQFRSIAPSVAIRSMCLVRANLLSRDP